MASTLGLDRLEGGYSQQVDTVLYSDPSPQQLCQSSLREAALTNLEALAAAGPPATPEVPSLSWEPLLCVQYERGNHSTGIHWDVVCFNHLVGGVLSDGVPLRDLLEKHSLPDLVNGDGAGLPEDVAAKISIRIEFPGCKKYTRQIMSRRSTSTGGPISLIALAHKIAEEMRKFMELTTEAHKPLIYDGRALETTDLLLCKLHRASSGSWVPEFKLPQWHLQM